MVSCAGVWPYVYSFQKMWVVHRLRYPMHILRNHLHASRSPFRVGSGDVHSFLTQSEVPWALLLE